jgi:hypothetical protein
VADRLVDFIAGDACVADGNYDTNKILEELERRGLKAVIPSGQERTKKRRHDRALYRLRYRVECFFHDLKRYRRIASRYDKTSACYTSATPGSSASPVHCSGCENPLRGMSGHWHLGRVDRSTGPRSPARRE